MPAEGWTVPKLWEGERCFIIAGGASAPLTLAGVGQLPGRVIAVKDAALLRPLADCLFYGDHLFHIERADVFNAYRGPLIVKRAVHDDVPGHVKQVRRWNAPEKSIDGLILGLCADPAMLGGWDSGGSAINLAYHLGVREIVLIGFDLAGVHWNKAHPLPRARMAAHARHRASIDAMAAPLARAGVKVWNTSPSSTLKGFEHASLARLV